MNSDAVDYVVCCSGSILNINPDSAQQQMDRLWARGFRPTAWGEALVATKAHLNDMRRIVSKQLKVEMPDVP